MASAGFESLRSRLRTAGVIGDEQGQFRLVAASCVACGCEQAQAVPVERRVVTCIQCRKPLT